MFVAGRESSGRGLFRQLRPDHLRSISGRGGVLLALIRSGKLTIWRVLEQ